MGELTGLELCSQCHSDVAETVLESTHDGLLECTTCHSIIAQGASDDLSQLDSDIAGVEFIHPLEIGDVWQTVKCTQCHTRESGY